MSCKVAMIGYGAVASVHASMLAAETGVELIAVCGPRLEKAAAFASTHGIKRACATIAEAVSGADVAIVCSPSELHFQQAYECLDRGVHTLVELPPCLSAADGEALGDLARRRGVVIGCAHTSRFLAPFALIRESIRESVLGHILEFSYSRLHQQVRVRSWADNALRHLSSHPVDILLDWCGGLDPQGCVATPDVEHAQTVAMLARLPNGGPATITVSYKARLTRIRGLVVGEHHTLETDGFTYLRSDSADLQFDGTFRHVYEKAIHDQDLQFLQAFEGRGSYVPWEETLKLVRTMDRFQALAAKA